MKIIKRKSRIKCIFKGLVIAILFAIIALSLFSILLVYTDISEEMIEPVVLVVKLISILLGITVGIVTVH